MDKLTADTALAPYRALDLTDETGHFCGKILADLGADVIKVEPPGGDPTRRHGPFYSDTADPEKSLQWWAFNTSKRGITLDIESASGRESLLRLVATADFFIESFSPGYLERLGLGYEALSQINPGLIYISISPFGQTGPYRDYKGSDLTLMAMGGQMYLAGDPDRPPVRISTPQAYLAASLHAAAGAMLALWHRALSGQGQYIDVSIQASIPHFMAAELPFWEYDHRLLRRDGPRRAISKHQVSQIYPCRDGHVSFLILGGPLGQLIRSLARWLEEEADISAPILMAVPWENLDLAQHSQQEIDSWEAALTSFFMRHTRAELYEGAVKRRIPLTPGNTIPDLVQYPQLAHRHFWAKVEHPELARRITYPGPPFKLSHTPYRLSRAPLLGEHNREVLASPSLTGVSPNPGTPASDPKDAVLSALSALSALSRQVGTLGTERTPRPPVGESLTKDSPKPLPLEGIVVADFTRVLIGPLLGKYLGDFGATIIRVESRLALDQHRVTVPYKGEPNLNRSGIFPILNSSKLSLGLNLSHPKGIEIAKKLIARCDVVLENFVPGVMEKWGLGYEDLEKIRPGIIMFRHSIQGQSGPYAHHPGFGWNVNALVGFNHLTGWPDREAVGPYLIYPDYVPAFWGVTAILAALDYRRRTGQGQCIDISQIEANLPLLSIPLLDYTANGRDSLRCGNKSPRAAPHNGYPCRGHDRWCAIAVETQDEWGRFSAALGNPPWAQDPRFATLPGRKANEEELDSLVAAWTVELPAEEVMARLQAAGVAAGVVQSTQDLLERDPQLRHRQQFLYLEQPDMGTALHQDWTVKLSRTPSQVRPAPAFGEHTEYICTQMLGLSDEELVELLAEGVLEMP